MNPYEYGQTQAFAKLGMVPTKLIGTETMSNLGRKLKGAKIQAGRKLEGAKQSMKRNPRKTNLLVGAAGVGTGMALTSGEKTAFIGWSTDLGAMGIPSAIGYGLANKPKNVEDAKARRDHGYSLLGGGFVPGYTGYHLGRASKARDFLADHDREAQTSDD